MRCDGKDTKEKKKKKKKKEVKKSVRKEEGRKEMGLPCSLIGQTLRILNYIYNRVK